MAVQPIVPGVYPIPLGFVNAFLILTDHLTLIDTGVPGSADAILETVRNLGRRPSDIRHILVTHCHRDHAGSLAALKQATGARVYMHRADAALVRSGRAMRAFRPTPGLINALLFKMIVPRGAVEIERAEIDEEVQDREDLPAAGGIRASHTPGHSAGHLVFLWPRHGGVLFAGDAAANVLGLGLSAGYEDIETGKRSLVKVAALNFAVACFGHGRPIRGGASERFRRKWRG